MLGGKGGSALLHHSDAVGLHHRDRMVALMEAYTAAAVKSLPEGFKQATVQPIELGTQRLQARVRMIWALGSV
ncbi:hypothetical protein J2789_003471 [Variovorax paradoxus]|nr:hypothetical protein [Variovorax paradoxus]